jgi:TRAP-type C4-dicarboxylate transport system permease small subunit
MILEEPQHLFCRRWRRACRIVVVVVVVVLLVLGIHGGYHQYD